VKLSTRLLPLPLLALPAAAALPAGLTAQLQADAVVHLEFQQVRTLAALSRPLKASGSLVVARDRGVIWALQKPIVITYVLGAHGLLVINPDGTRERRSERDAPVAAQAAKVFQAVAQGDWNALDSWFAASGSGTPQHWEVALQARPQAANLVRRVRLEGGRFIDRIRLDEPGGDRTELDFTGQRADLPLTPEETRLLDQD